MSKFSTIIFDVDGVLLDSLEPHLQICRDKNKEFGLGLDIPEQEPFKALVNQGVQISPMKYFFLAVGFPEDKAVAADDYYQQNFSKEYQVLPYPGTEDLLKTLCEANYHLGIVTANNLQNITRGLGDLMNYFDKDLIFTAEPGTTTTKTDALKYILQESDMKKESVVFVGDQPKDAEAANNVEIEFIAVSYGWGFTRDHATYPVAHNPVDILDLL